jgi:ornithine cyclodeaminase
MRLLCEQDVERLIDPQHAIAAAAEAYRRHAAGMMPKPSRLDLKRENPKGGILVLAGYSHDGLFVVKSNAHSYPDATASRRNAASMLILWDATEPVPLALIGTTGFNNHRTAAGFAAAAKVLARPDARTLAVFGAGKIAPATIRYLAAVRRPDRVLIAGRGPDRALALAQAACQWPRFDSVRVEAETDPARAANAADVIATVTTSDEPVFPGDAVRPGTLVILGGANRPAAREADDVLISRSKIFVDHLDGCLERAGDLVIPLESGALSRSQISGEIGTLIGKGDRQRSAGTDVTVFKSIGIVAQDLVTAAMLLERAKQMDVGIEFDPRDGSVMKALVPVMRTSALVAARGEPTGHKEP